MNWQTGKARCRSDEYEAEIGIVDEAGIYGRYRHKGEGRWFATQWALDGSYPHDYLEGIDLIPPRLSLEEAARECVIKVGIHESWNPTVLCVIQHFVKLQEEGLV